MNKLMKITLYLSLLFTFIATSISCQANTIHGNERIVVVFNAVNQYDSLKLLDGHHVVNQASVNYISEFYQEKQVMMHYKGKNDTLNIDCNTDKIVLGIRYFDSEWIYYLLYKGDTARITYKNNFPWCSVVNRSCGECDLNFQAIKRQRFNETEPQSLNFYMLNFKKGSNINDYSIRKYNGLLLEMKYIDSLRSVNLLSEEYEQFHKDNLRLSFLSSKNLNSNASITPVLEYKPSDFKRDTLLNNRNYFWFLQFYVNNKLQFTKPQVVPGGIVVDSRVIYDSLRRCKIFSKKIKEFLLLNYFQEICEKGSSDDIKKYYPKFKNDVTDMPLVSFVAKKYMINEENIKVDVIDIQLITKVGEKTYLKKILAAQRGKVVIIDFWASWCAPCRQLMPHTKNLIEQYKGRGLVVIYISIDKINSDWLKACSDEKINDYPFNYQAILSKTSLLETLQLRMIPRGIMFDKQGRLVCKDTPRQGTSQLNDMINTYLK